MKIVINIYADTFLLCHEALSMAFALAASSTAADVRACLVAYTFGWAENMVQAAIKSVPLGQSAGQRVLSHIVAEIPAAVQREFVRLWPVARHPCVTSGP